MGHGYFTGKTLVATELGRQIRESKEHPRLRALIVAPLNTHPGWESTIRRQLGEEVAIYTVGTPQADPDNWGRMIGAFKLPGVFIIGWEAMAGRIEKVKDPNTREVIKEISHIPPWQHTGTWDLVVADECHRMQNRRSLAAKVMNIINAERKLAMSGTPAGNKPEGIWSTLHWLWPGKYPHYWPWVNERMKTEPCPYAHIKIIGEKEPGSTIADIPSYSRVELMDVVADLPEVIERRVEVDMLPTQAKIYKNFLDQAFAWLDEQPVDTPLPITQRIRLRQVALGNPNAGIVVKTKRRTMERTVRKEVVRESGASDHDLMQEAWDTWDGVTPFEEWEKSVFDSGKTTDYVWDTVEVEEEYDEEKLEVFFKPTTTSNKITAVKEILSDLPEDEPVMIYTHSRRFVEPVVHQLGKNAVAWTGETKQEERRRILQTFGRKGGPRIIVAVIAAISEGTDGLQLVCANEIWLSKDENNLLNEQCKARLVRSGQERPVNRWYIESRDTIDQGVYLRTEENTITMKEFYRGA